MNDLFRSSANGWSFMNPRTLRITIYRRLCDHISNSVYNGSIKWNLYIYPQRVSLTIYYIDNLITLIISILPRYHRIHLTPYVKCMTRHWRCTFRPCAPYTVALCILSICLAYGEGKPWGPGLSKTRKLTCVRHLLTHLPMKITSGIWCHANGCIANGFIIFTHTLLPVL